MKRMRKCIDEVYQIAKDQALVKKLKKTKDLGQDGHNFLTSAW
jgi:hypothetical protein